MPPLAVVGLSLKFPGNADTPDEFWNMLAQGRSAASEFPEDRLNAGAHYHEDRTRLDRLSLKGGYFMKEDLSLFDAAFFNMNAAEAEAMDPQQRIILETVYRALENAGYPIDQITGTKTCVFAGSFSHDYHVMLTKDPMQLPKTCATGTSMNMLSNKQGLAVGSNILLALDSMLCLDNLGLLSKDGQSHSFDERANGYGRGEGVAALFIRPLEDALRHGDTIRAVIRSSGANQDGKTPGIMEPSMEMQAQLIRETYQKAGLDLGMTRYVEAHGTGTAVGDPTEARAIGSIFRKYRTLEDPLYIGSVKSSVGHLEGASGLAGVIKTILMLEKGVIPATADLNQLNPRIDGDFLNIKIPNEAVPWSADGLRRASVSSFGFGGSNNHIVLDDALGYLRCHYQNGNHNVVHRPRESRDTFLETTEINKDRETPRLLVWSTSDENGISRIQATWKSHLASLQLFGKDKEIYLENLAYTLAARRSHLAWRTFAVIPSSGSCTEVINRISKPTNSNPSANVAFLFSGQGAQWYAMGRELIDAYSVFRDGIRDANTFLKSLNCEWDLFEELGRSENDSNVNQTEYSQTLCTALQVALVDLLHHFNVMPKFVVGHSSGEIAAAYCAGAISRQSAWKIAYYRGTWSAMVERNSLFQGSMLAVGLSSQEVKPFIKRLDNEFETLKVIVACINSPKSITLSGEANQIETLKAHFDRDHIFCRKLQVKVAYHSFQMKEIATQYEVAMGALEKGVEQRGRPQMISSVTGTWIAHDFLVQASYWVGNMISPVNFSDALTTLLSGETETRKRKIDGSHRRAFKIDHILEVGPHSALQGPCKDVLNNCGKQSVQYETMLVRGVSAIDTVLNVAGRLFVAGYAIDLSLVNAFHSLRGSDRTLKALSDLPEYPFNHSRSYWHESQMSRNTRLPQFAPNELLGAQHPNWNPLEPQWRNIIRASHLPWVKDHRINGSIIYPGAGMIVMVIEGAKQISKEGRKTSGFNLNDLVLHAAIQISDVVEECETSLHMHRVEQMTSKDADWFQFRIYSLSNKSWALNCSGSIQVLYHDKEFKPAFGSQVELELQKRQQDSYLQTRKKCVMTANAESFYSHLRKCGYGYGQAFQNVTSVGMIPKNQNVVVCDVRNPHFSRNETIHPTSLDAIIQTALWPATQFGDKVVPTSVPTFLKSIWISAETPQARSDVLEVHTETGPSRNGKYLSRITAWNETSGNPVVVLDGLECTSVSVVSSSETKASSKGKLCHRIEWKPDLRLLDNEVAKKLCELEDDFVSPEELYIQADFVLLVNLLRGLDAVSRKGYKAAKYHQIKYLEWSLQKKRQLDEGHSMFSSNPWKIRLTDHAYIERLESQLEAANDEARFLVTVAKNLPQLLTNELAPLEFLYTDDLIGNYYNALHRSPGAMQLKKYLDLEAHLNPQMNILELGSGTGSSTEIFLDALGRSSDGSVSSRYGRWDYTDISPGFFGGAAERFKEEGNRMNFKVLNIEIDPEQQGFECGRYDMVVASLVLHATPDLSKSLTHCRKLLRPGGKLIICEMTAPARSSVIFGLLEGWWLSSEPYRQDGPCVDESRWHELLLQTGFSGCDIVFRDFEDAICHESSFIITSATAEIRQKPHSEATIEIILDPHNTAQTDFGSQLRRSCEVAGYSVEYRSLSSAQSSHSFLRVFLLEYSDPLMYDMDGEQFHTLQSLFLSTTTTLWITQGGCGVSTHPKYHLIDGLFRVLAEEDNRQNRYILSLETLDSNVSHHSRLAMSLISHILSSAKNQYNDLSFMEENGMLQVGRVVPHSKLETAISAQAEPGNATKHKFGCGIPVRLDNQRSSLLQGFQFVEFQPSPLAGNEMEVQIACVGVNFRDVLIALGQLNEDSIGHEYSGIVTRVGATCKRFKPGDHIVGLAPNCCVSHLRVREGEPAVLIPKQLSLSSAASIPVNFLTAYIGLKDVSGLHESQTVLIHCAAGGTGQAAVQIAKYIGAEIFATVGSEAKKAFLVEAYGVKQENIFSSRSSIFAKAIMDRTFGKGVDVVFNSLSGELLVKSWECLAAFGTFVEIGKRDIMSNNNLPMAQFSKNCTFSAVDLAELTRTRPEICTSALSLILSLMTEQRLQPPSPVRVYGVGEIEKAFRAMQGGNHHGKMVIEMRENDQMVLQARGHSSFDYSGTYVVAGGFGGLGQIIIRWLVSRGVRNILVLSRSGPKGNDAETMMAELHIQGVNLMAPPCDLCDKNSLCEVINECHSMMPPIKGCIQAATGWHDIAFEDMEFSGWQTAVNPKARGSWNLHEVLPTGLDFFIMLSSVSGLIATKGQSNYAAGNTFQDALCHYRLGLGEKATSLDLGVMTFAGVVAKNEVLLHRTEENSTLRPVTEGQFCAALDIYCNPQVCRDMDLDHQPSIGIHPEVTERGAGTAYWLDRPLFNHLNLDDISTGPHLDQIGGLDIATAFRTSKSLEQVIEVVTDALKQKLCKAILLGANELDINLPLHQYGVDSLVAVELRAWFLKEMQADIAVFDIMGRASVTSIAPLVAIRSKLTKGWIASM
ncbi:uncharacterized protein N7511_004674 [Penicillium nucicola]|uniref:uncharacterized protein n=1 Tax=Penicillium nucicola TaxID=1850975 RepID=UPI0025456864|nr:uncharacterized protein N7511_004674 [Penicillium nucicola]KAJ5767058.1 hypothetical protein N7511_004674 [Penicillium nucicola]